MIADFLTRRARRQRERRSRLADDLSSRLTREQSLAVDDTLIAALGVDRRAFFRAVYSMVIQERMHMMADENGDVRLMTNGEFHRFMLRRSGLRETEIRARGVPDMAGISEFAEAGAEAEETVFVEPVTAEFVAPLSGPDSSPAAEVAAEAPHDDLGWFNLDVSPESDSREKLPDARQTLPDRRREPWPAAEESAVHF